MAAAEEEGVYCFFYAAVGCSCGDCLGSNVLF